MEIINQEIQIPSGVKYLGEVLTCLPENCIFDKSVTGCGGTTVALSCPSNYVICVPFVSLIQNKLAQHDNVLGIYKGTKTKDIKSYVSNDDIKYKKIMVTYDSLHKLEKYINPKDYKLLIDEYHLLFNCYSFRNKAVKDVLNIYQKYQSHCFMTATLLEREFILTELKDVPIITARWDTVKEVTVHSVKCESDVIHTVANLVNEYIEGKRSGNAYFFVNSVEFIKNVIETCNLNDDNTRAIWSTSNKTQTGVARGNTLGEPKKINFMTSTVFEGCDLKDEEGRIYIISDGSKAHTIVDISTSFQQIAGRIRNTKYKDIITHIYNETRYSVNVSYDEYKIISDLEVEKNKNIATIFPTLNEDVKEKWIVMQSLLEKESAYNSYLRLDGKEVYFDENLAKIDLYNFKVTKSIYKIRINLTEEYRKNGFLVETEDSQLNDVVVVKPKMNFKDTVLECQKGDVDFVLKAYGQYPFLNEAITKIGYSGIEKSNYNITTIKRKLVTMSSGSQKQKILQYLKTSSYIYDGGFISIASTKKLFESAYKELGIPSKPKSTAINDYFYTKVVDKKIKHEVITIVDNTEIKKIEWKPNRGYSIIKAKF